ncbi:MAG: hypothetical protein ACYTG1_07535 [Planctomycetota bacterium]|jgi:hypothetical protein
MRVLLDETPCDIEARTVGEAIAAGAALAEGHGRLIIEIVVDGAPWTDERLHQPGGVSAAADEVRLVSADRAALVRTTLGEATDALEEADRLQQEAAALLQGDRASEAMPLVAEALSIWSSVREALELTAEAVGLRLDLVVVDGTPAAAIVSGLGDRLRSLRAALQHGDPVALADTLLYELPGDIAAWRGLLDELRGLEAPPETGS